MRRTAIASFVMLVSLAAAMPALAAPLICNRETVRNERGRLVSKIEANPLLYIGELRDLGYDVDRVEDFNGCIRAWVRQPGGGQTMAFFDPDTLQRLR